MTPLQEWFFMHVEGNVPNAQVCREIFDKEFSHLTVGLNQRIREALEEVLPRVSQGDNLEDDKITDLFEELVNHVRGALEAAAYEEETCGVVLDCPEVKRAAVCLTTSLILGSQ
jgi:hypothetical protein